MEAITDKAWLEEALRQARRRDDTRRTAELTRALIEAGERVTLRVARGPSDPGEGVDAAGLIPSLRSDQGVRLAAPGDAPLPWDRDVARSWLASCAGETLQTLATCPLHAATRSFLEALSEGRVEAQSSWPEWPAHAARWLTNLEATALLPTRGERPPVTWEDFARQPFERACEAARVRMGARLLEHLTQGRRMEPPHESADCLAFPIGGTVWAGPGDPAGGHFVYEFQPSGALHYTSQTGFWTIATWSQDGSAASMETNHRYCEYEGHITRLRMEGRAHNVTDIEPWWWSAQLLG